jgi:hypothetical protein
MERVYLLATVLSFGTAKEERRFDFLSKLKPVILIFCNVNGKYFLHLLPLPQAEEVPKLLVLKCGQFGAIDTFLETETVAF